jgi:hypothetical protein
MYQIIERIVEVRSGKRLVGFVPAYSLLIDGVMILSDGDISDVIERMGL